MKSWWEKFHNQRRIKGISYSHHHNEEQIIKACFSVDYDSASAQKTPYKMHSTNDICIANGRQQVKVPIGFLCNRESYWGNLMRCCHAWGGGHSESRSSSYSAVVTHRKPQFDRMSPASLSSSLLPLHNWSHVNVIIITLEFSPFRDKDKGSTDSHPTVAALKKKTIRGIMCIHSAWSWDFVEN